MRATSIGLIARATPLHPPGAPEVDASSQPERHDRALSNSVATPGQAAVPYEAVGACSRSVPAGTIKPVPRSSDAAARRATVSHPDVALLSSPRRRRPDRGLRRPAMAETHRRPATLTRFCFVAGAEPSHRLPLRRVADREQSCAAVPPMRRSPRRSAGSGGCGRSATRSCARPRQPACPRWRCPTSAGRPLGRGVGRRYFFAASK